MAKYVIFKNPYILIEDVRTRQQPFYKEYEAKQPKLSLNSPALGCPFVENMKRRIMPPKNKDLKPGVCEICYCKFAQYKEHLATPEHRDFAVDNRNYKEVDRLIAEFSSVDNGRKVLNTIVPSVDGFISDFLMHN